MLPDDPAWQDEMYNEMNWPDEMDYSMFDLVMHPLALSAENLRARLRTHKQRVMTKLSQQETVRTLEKFTFVFGVTCLWSGAFVVGKMPDLFPHWYTLLAVILFTVRWFSYKAIQWHYFCFDLCYFLNFLTLLWLWVFPQTKSLYIAVFSLNNGPIAWAILAWRNSMVFHSLDKVITVFIHLAPPVLMFNMRWMCDTSNDLDDDAGDYHNRGLINYYLYDHLTHGRNPLGKQHEMNYFESLFYALAFYMTWQTLYFLGINTLKGSKVAAGLRMTSYSWLLDDKKNQQKPSLMYRLCNVPIFSSNNVMIRIFMFMFWQWLYCLVSIAPVTLFYRYFYLHAAYIVFLLTACIWNGGCYYLEVFSGKSTKTPQKQQEEKQEVSSVETSKEK
jgi:hypothetical protein